MTRPAALDMDLAPSHRLVDRHLVYDNPFQIDIDSLRLTIRPGVFCPAFTQTSRFLARQVTVDPTDRVLDMFSGSGYQGLLAARTGAQVVCVDAFEDATGCALINAEANQLADRVTALTGDLFDPVIGQRFDVIIANPPLLPGVPKTPLEAAIFDADLATTKRFLDELGTHFAPGGKAFLITTDAHRGLHLLDIETYGKARGLAMVAIARHPTPYETYTVYAVTRTGRQ